MARILLRIVVALVVLAGLGTIYGFQKLTSLEARLVSGDVHVILPPDAAGMGGNTSVLRTDDGAVVVDTMTFRRQGARIRELAEKLGGGPTQAIVNTHYHADHTHGNPAFPPGSRVLASDQTLAYLDAWDADYWSGAAGGTLPSETVSGDHEIRVGGKTIRIVHPGAGHTGGDVVVLFVEDRVLATGDLFFHGRYPFIDVAGGGSAREWSQSLERVLALDFDHVVPGHGPVTDRQGLRRFQRFMQDVWSAGSAAARAGKSREELLASAELTGDEGFEVMWLPFVFRIDRANVLETAWGEALGALRPRPLDDDSGGTP